MNIYKHSIYNFLITDSFSKSTKIKESLNVSVNIVVRNIIGLYMWSPVYNLVHVSVAGLIKNPAYNSKISKKQKLLIIEELVK